MRAAKEFDFDLIREVDDGRLESLTLRFLGSFLL